MGVSLNFSSVGIREIEKALRSFEKGLVTSIHEVGRWKVDNSTVTLYKSGKLTVQGKDEEKVKAEILRLVKGKSELVLGIDEAGRGELTGPFVISGVIGETQNLREGRDSKKVTDKKKAYGKVTKNALMHSTFSLNPEFIDRLRTRDFTLDEIQGIIMDSLAGIAAKLERGVLVKADGKKLPLKSKKVEFIVKGDDKEPVIGAASIAAKYTRSISSNKEKRKSWSNYRK